MMVADTVASFGLDGKQAEQTLEKIGIATNKQVIPDDPNPPLRPSGIRIGTPASTTRGMTEADMRQIASWIAEALSNPGDEARIDENCRRGPQSECEVPDSWLRFAAVVSAALADHAANKKRAALASGPSVNCEL